MTPIAGGGGKKTKRLSLTQIAAATENLKTKQITAAIAQWSKGWGKERKKLDKITVSLTHIAAATLKNKKNKN